MELRNKVRDTCTGCCTSLTPLSQKHTKRSWSICTRNMLFILANIFLTLAISIFLSPLISCPALPPLVQRYCPIPPGPPPANAFNMIPTFPPKAIHLNLNLASSTQGAIPLPVMSFVGQGSVQKWWSTMIWRALRSHYTSADLALNDDPDNCWQFSGNTAQLAVRLADCVVIDRVVLSHSTSMQTPTASAPRHIMIWGMVEGEENFSELSRFTDFSNTLASLFAKTAVANPILPRPRFQGHIFLPLVSSVYNPSGPKEQEFKVFPEIKALGVDFGVVVVQISDNWGAPTTSVCHIGVYGKKLA